MEVEVEVDATERSISEGEEGTCKRASASDVSQTVGRVDHLLADEDRFPIQHEHEHEQEQQPPRKKKGRVVAGESSIPVSPTVHADDGAGDHDDQGNVKRSHQWILYRQQPQSRPRSSHPLTASDNNTHNHSTSTTTTTTNRLLLTEHLANPSDVVESLTGDLESWSLTHLKSNQPQKTSNAATTAARVPAATATATATATTSRAAKQSEMRAFLWNTQRQTKMKTKTSIPTSTSTSSPLHD